jgi:hypothetical protein
MDRRLFFKTAALLGLEASSLQAGVKGDPVVHFVDDPGEWFSVRHGWVTCDAERTPNGSWSCEITIYVRQIDFEGGFQERRMVPTDLLKSALEEAGLETEFDGCPLFPSLVGHLPPSASPSSVLTSIRQIMDGADQRSLWVDLFPQEWANYRMSIPAPGPEIRVPRPA